MPRLALRSPGPRRAAALLAALLAAGCADPAEWADAGPPPDDGPSTRDAFVLPMADAMVIARPDGMTDGTVDNMPDDMGWDTEPDNTAPVDMAWPDMSTDATPADAALEGPPPYPADRLHSPLTPWIAERLRAIAERAPRAADVFAKIGDSITVSRAFLHCFGTDAFELDGRDALWPTIAHFQAGDAAGADPFRRESAAASVGWSVQSALRGDPAPVDVELDALDPRFAVVMFGTNDIQARDLDGYAGHLWTLVDRLIDGGVIPLLSTVPPRDDDAEADAWVPRYNAVVRAVAQGRQVPLVDLHRALLPLPDHGLGPDRLHPNTAPTGACDLRPDGLRFGYNTRNLLTITALDRARRALETPAPDPPARAIDATGGADDPIPITALPFTDLRDTRDSPHRALDAYPGCQAPQDESGPEYVYALHLDRPTIVRARVFDRGDVDVDLHLLAAPDDPGACLDRDHHTLEASLAAGTWYFAIDTYVDGAGERSGEFLFTLIED